MAMGCICGSVRPQSECHRVFRIENCRTVPLGSRRQRPSPYDSRGGRHKSFQRRNPIRRNETDDVMLAAEAQRSDNVVCGLRTNCKADDLTSVEDLLIGRSDFNVSESLRDPFSDSRIARRDPNLRESLFSCSKTLNDGFSNCSCAYKSYSGNIHLTVELSAKV